MRRFVAPLIAALCLPATAMAAAPIANDGLARIHMQVETGFLSGEERQVVNLAAATQDTDAVNLSQLHPLANTLGGGASYAGGVFTAPSFTIQGSSFNTVGAAFAAVDARLTALAANVGGPAGPQGPAGHTPVKGTDYWTAADQTSMVNDVLAALPTWSGGAY